MITIAQARRIIAAAEARAEAIGVPVSIAVLNAGTYLKAFSGMDGAALGSIDLAIGKARTAVLFGLRSEELWEFCGPGGVAPGLERSNGGLVTFGGGIPLMDADGAMIGALGVSGGTVFQDLDIARTAAGEQRLETSLPEMRERMAS